MGHLNCRDSVNDCPIILIFLKTQALKGSLKPSLLKLVKILSFSSENCNLMNEVPEALFAAPVAQSAKI